jgi:outer membrane immunogenic protein
VKTASIGVIIIAAAIGAPAHAADMTLNAPPAVASWTGPYVGATLGAKWAKDTWTTTSLVTPFPTTIDASSPRNYDPSGFRAGGYVGYDWQFAPQWVAGVEFDLADTNNTIRTAGVPGCSIVCVGGFPGPLIDLSSVKLGWDASARGRLGYLVSPNLLAYGTGGAAWQSIEASATCQHSAPDPLCLVLPGNPFSTATNSVVRTGWTIGAGLEARVWGNWTLRGEYRYAYFGGWGDQLNLSLPGSPNVVGYRSRFDTQIVTLGVAYKFAL